MTIDTVTSNAKARPHYEFADAAKAVAILLLVLWHVLGKEYLLMEMLKFLRMPLFFFVSGLFAQKAISMTWPGLIRFRVSHLLYLYVLWAYVFVAERVFRGYIGGHSVDIPTPIQLIYDAPGTIWFVYALAIAYLLARLLRPLPSSLVVAAATVVYCISALSGNWYELPIEAKVMRLFPFFVLALLYRAQILEFVERAYMVWPLFLLAYLVGSYFAVGTVLASVGPFTMGLSLVGILGVLCICRQFMETDAVKALAWVGARTIHIYLLHRLLLPYVEWGFRRMGNADGIVPELAIASMVSLLCLAIGHFILRPFLPWLERAPWVAPSVRMPVFQATSSGR